MEIKVIGTNSYQTNIMINEIPTICPQCLRAINAIQCGGYFRELSRTGGSTHIEIEVVFRCPKSDCGKVILALYVGELSKKQAEYIASYPGIKERIEFDEELERISPMYCTVFSQAQEAEEEKLDQVCGMGYRKALEYLIKDYLIHLNPSERDKYVRVALGQCIRDHVPDPNIKLMAERAAWLGNDEVHYERKYQNVDIAMLKDLIRLTEYWILSHEKTKKYVQKIVKA